MAANYANNLRSLAAMIAAERAIQAATEDQLKAWLPLFIAALVPAGTTSVVPSTQGADHLRNQWLTVGMAVILAVALAARKKRYKRMRPNGYSQAAEDAFAAEVRQTARRIPERSFQIANDIIADGVRAGWSVERIQNEITQAVNEAVETTAERTGRIIGPSAINSGTLDAFSDIEATSDRRFVKSWVSMMDSHVRPTHADAHADPANHRIPLSVKFQVGGELADRPRDPELSIDESAGCRCIAAVEPA